jgi:pyruvate-formate lyase-activating enzyme
VACAARIAHEFGLRVALETHGLAVEALDEVIDEIDYVSMDWKLESDVRRARADAVSPPFHQGHAAFLARVQQAGVDASVKVVITRNTTSQELDEVCRGIAATSPKVPLILQPVTPFGQIRERPSAQELLAHLRCCERQLEDVRLIPQTHRVYGAP